MAMGYPPFTALAAVHLGGSQGVGTRLTVDGRRGVLEASRVGHAAHHVVRQRLERIRRAVGEGLPERGEELVEFRLPVGVAPCTQHADGLVARPDGPPGCWVAVVQGELRLVQRRLPPGQEILAVGHAPRMRSCALFPGARGPTMVATPSVNARHCPSAAHRDQSGTVVLDELATCSRCFGRFTNARMALMTPRREWLPRPRACRVDDHHRTD